MFDPQKITTDVHLRLLRPEDSSLLANAYLRNRDHLAPWEPDRQEEFFTEQFQVEDIERRLALAATGEAFPLALVSNGRLVGRFNLAGISRGPFQSAGLGYWIDKDYQGRGLSSAAVSAIVQVARTTLGLHRIEASTLIHNVASQQVLIKNGFHQIGMAPHYLRIAGTWQDHNLYQVLLHD